MDAFDPFASDNDEEQQPATQDFFHVETNVAPMRPQEDEDDSLSHDNMGNDNGAEADVFGDSLADVDIWGDDDEDENPFARPEVKDNLSFGGGFDESKDKDDRTKSRRSHGHGDTSKKKRESSSQSKSRDHKRDHKSSGKPRRAKSSDDIEMLVPELNSFLASPSSDSKRSDRDPSPSKRSSRSRQGAPRRSKSSDDATEEFDQLAGGNPEERIDELLDLLKKEYDEVPSPSMRREKSSRDKNGGSSLRQKLMSETVPSKRRTSSSVVSGSSNSRRSSSKRNSAPSSSSFQESFQSWDEGNVRDRQRHSRSGSGGDGSSRRPGSRKSGSRSSKSGNSGEEEGGLDSYMKSSNRRSSRRDAEHRSVVSAPPATTTEDELSKRCQKMNLNF